MKKYEFKIVPAPQNVQRGWFQAKDDGFANTVTELMNEMGACGWDYVRSETLSFGRRRWYGAKRVERHEVLVFRRTIAEEVPVEEKARIVLTEPETFAPVTPRRVRDAGAVARVKAGARKIEIVGSRMAQVAANSAPMTAAE